MKNTLSIAFLLFAGSTAMAQLPEDVMRLHYNTVSGTARSQAIGGAIGSLGGDITSNYVNPAGLGLYKLSETVISPGFTLARSKSDYRGYDATSNNLNRFNISTSGVVWAKNEPGRKWNSSAFSIAVNRTANFNNSVFYKGENDEHSISTVFADEFANSRLRIDQVRNSNLSMGTKMAIYTYLIDTATTSNGLEVIGKPEYLDRVIQQNRIKTTGGITEIAIGFAGNNQDKFYIGGSVGIPIVKYERRTEFTESDPTTDRTNNFGFTRFEERLTTTGVGLNAKLGVIFKPAQQLRIGLAFNSPTIYGLRDKVWNKMVTDVEGLFGPNDPGIDSVTSDYYNNNQTPVYKFDMTSPMKFILSGSYIFHEVEDVTAQRGFITADAEWVTFGSSRFSPSEENDDESYYDNLNQTVKGYYKGVLNLRVGGELKFNTFMVRGGYARYGDPYEQSALKASRSIISGGIGYRDNGIFIDLTYAHTIYKDVHFPYRLAENNTYADIKSRIGQVLLTFGFKFY
jgi:hypothetical protein